MQRCVTAIREVLERPARGQIFVLTAFVFVLVLGLIGGGVDYGLMLIEKTQLQNAVDAAALAGASGLVSAPTPGITSAQATVTRNLGLHGYTNGVNNTTVTSAFVTPTPTGADIVTVAAARQKETLFWRLFGINSVTVRGSAVAVAGRGLFDVVLSVDETNSMSNEDMDQLRAASQAFVDQLSLSTSNPRSSKVGMTQFQGRVGCGVGGGCRLDAHVLSNLTSDPAVLSKLINDSGGGPCPSISSLQPPSGTFTNAASSNAYACQLKTAGGGFGTGTYLVSGLSITFMPSIGWDLWSTARGGRSDAKKVLVLETDGNNNIDNPPGGNMSVAQADANSIAAANAIKLGADGISGTADDVEIYTIGFFDEGDAAPDGSGLISGPTPLCPSNTLPGGTRAADDVLIGMSSSKPGTCDHYFPLAKSSNLPQVFVKIASAITRSRLVQ